MVWGIFSWCHFWTLSTNWASINATAYLSIVADHVHPFMTTVYPSSDGYFQQDNAHCHKAQIISDWFLEHDNEFIFLKWPPQSPDLNPIEHLWDVVEREIRIMDVQLTNLQKLCDVIMSIWTKISEECFQHLVESMPQIIKTVLKAKVGPTRYYQGVHNKVASKYVYIYIYICICIYTSVGRYSNFLYCHIASLWDRNTRYYRAWVGGGRRETLCTCHRLFHNDLVILKRGRERGRESLEVPITKIIYFQTYWKTNMLNIKIFKTASSYSDTAVIHRY